MTVPGHESGLSMHEYRSDAVNHVWIAEPLRTGYVAILMLVGLVWSIATLEGIIRSFGLDLPYDWRAYGATACDVLVRLAVDATGLSITLPIINWAYLHRLTNMELDSISSIALLAISQEFFYYWYHRCAHQVRWFWASHAVHHSPNELTLMSALRLGWTGRLSGMSLFFLPLIWLGYSPKAVMGAVAINLTYQFWLHATWIPKLGPFEWVLNTPSHHRVHHGSNPPYLDCNFGGVLIVFDRLFGTLVEEDDRIPLKVGLTQPIWSYNAWLISVHEWLALARDLKSATGFRQGVKLLFGRPGRTPSH